MITGAGGMLGRDLLAVAHRRGHTVTALGIEDLDITDEQAVSRAVSDCTPDAVINAAAYTDVDGAEAERGEAFRVNADGPGYLAKACAACDALLVHYSTDYVFDGQGDTAWHADAPTSPLNVYGESKLAGEQAIKAEDARYLIMRTSWLYAAHGQNFVRSILRLAESRSSLDVVDDQRGRPTFASDLADMTFRLIETVNDGNDRSCRRILHAANDGACTWYEFASEIITLMDAPCTVHPCTSDRFPRPAARPGNSVLDLTDLIELIGRPRHWRDALAECIGQIKQATIESA